MPRPEALYQYQEIARQLRTAILRGDYRENGKLPSERQLGEQFRVQRNTIRQALDVLEREGQIITEGKRGSFVRENRPSRRNTLLVSMHSDLSPELSHLMEGFRQTASKAGFAVRRYDTQPAEGAALDLVPKVETLDPDVAGVALWPQNPSDVQALTRLNESIPLVLVDRRVIGVSADCVRFDDVSGGRMITEHLISQGHRRIAFLTDEVFAETVQHRWQGYAWALEAAGIPVIPALSMFFNGLHEPFFGIAMRHLFTHETARPTAIVCSNDLVAFTILRFLRDEGIRVPDDVAVTGYGNSMPNYTGAMALTSVEQPFSEVGAAAARILIDRLGQSSDDRLRRPLDVTVPLQLAVRGSSGVPAGASL